MNDYENCKGLRTYATCLEDSHADTNTRHCYYHHGVVVVVVSNPQTKAEELEDVEWIEDFEAEECQKVFHGNDYHVVTVNTSSTK